MLPTAFLRQLISYYGDQMQMVVPTFLEHSMKTFSDQQSQMQEHMAKAFGDGSLARNFQAPLQMMEEQIRRNTELFRQAMQGFTPFAMPQAPKETRKPNASEIDELKAQLRALQQKLDQL
ncbi:PHB accumulation regulatory domain protein [compost metagenome]